MTSLSTLRFAAIVIAGTLSGCGVTQPAQTADAQVQLSPDNLVWSPARSLPPGAQSVVLDGDPSRPALFTVRLTIPADFRIPPHKHAGTERLTVLSGSIFLGYGDSLDTHDALYLPAGSYAVNPAGVHHFSWTREAAVVQLTAMGPWVLEYIDPKDDPRARDAAR